MTDILERLDAASVGHPHAKISWPHRLFHDAATEITNLRAELARVTAERDRLRVDCDGERTLTSASQDMYQRMKARALAAEAALAKAVGEDADDQPTWKGHEAVERILGLKERYLRNLCLSVWDETEDGRAWHAAEANEVFLAYQAEFARLHAAIRSRAQTGE